MSYTAGQNIPYGPGPVYPTHTYPWGPGPVIPTHHQINPYHPGPVIPSHHPIGPFGPGPVENPTYYEGKVSWPPSASRIDVLTGGYLIMRSLHHDGYKCPVPSITIDGSTGYLTASFNLTVPWILSNQTIVDSNWVRAVQSDTLADGHVNDGIVRSAQDPQDEIVLPNYYEGKVTWPPTATASDVTTGCHTIVTVLRENLYASEYQTSVDGSTGYTTATFKIRFYGIFRELGNIEKVWNKAVDADTIEDGHKNLGVVPEYQDDKTKNKAIGENTYEGTVIWPPTALEKDITEGCQEIIAALRARRYTCEDPIITVNGSTGYSTARFDIRYNPPQYTVMHNPYNDWNAAVAKDTFKDGHQSKGLVPTNSNATVIRKIYEGKVTWPPSASQDDISAGCSKITKYLSDRSYQCPHHMSWNPSTGYSTATFIIRFHPAHPVIWNNPFTDWNLAVASDTLKDGHINEGLTTLVQDGQANGFTPPPYHMNTYQGTVTWPPTATKDDIDTGCEIIKKKLEANSFDVSYGITADGSTGYRTARFLLIPTGSTEYNFSTVTDDWNKAVAADAKEDGHENKGLRQLLTGTTKTTKATNDANGAANGGAPEVKA